MFVLSLADSDALPDPPNNDQAFHAFVEEQHPRIVRFLDGYTGDLAVAEELAQEAFVRAGVHWRRISSYDAPAAWVRRVAINLANSWYRRRQAERRAVKRLSGRREDEGTLEPPTELDPSLRAAIAALPRRQREAIVHRFVMDRTVEETAAEMGCSGQAVRSLTTRGLATVRESIGADDGG